MTTPIPVQRLRANAGSAYLEHLLALPAEDIRLRFGSAESPDTITAYVRNIDFDRDEVFGVYGAGLVLVGGAHLALAENAGGYLGPDAAVATVTILEATST